MTQALAAHTPAADESTDQGLRIRGLRKTYGETIALDGLDIDARPGEILGIAGPNGAGKSTLIKILVAETGADAGEVWLDGEPWLPDKHPDRVAVVHQEPQLFPNLTVAENLLVGREGTRFSRPALDEAERALLDDLNIIDLASQPLEFVPLAVQQRTEIGRALARSARVFLFDEPNSALTDDESADLFRRMHLLAETGHVVMLVSHRLGELVDHADRVAIILDGRRTSVIEGADLTLDAIAAELVTTQAIREPAQQHVVEVGDDADSVLTLKGWSHQGGAFTGVDLHVVAGEVVALLGVEGSGARELVRSIAGFERGSGHLEIHERGVAGASRSESSFVSADRQASLFTNLSIGDNIVSRLNREIVRAGGVLRRGRMREIAEEIRQSFQVKAGSIDLPIRSLSGGNQQKVAIAAAIVKRPEVLVLEEPTRGVDIGSKSEIYRLMREYAGSGHAVVIFCTEVPEVFEAADLAYVVSDGRISEPIQVQNYEDVESLAVAVTRLERHAADRDSDAGVSAGVEPGDGEGTQTQP